MGNNASKCNDAINASNKDKFCVGQRGRNDDYSNGNEIVTRNGYVKREFQTIQGSWISKSEIMKAGQLENQFDDKNSGR